MSNSVRENNRDLFRSTLYHFQRAMPEIQSVNGLPKLNPAFVVFMKQRGIDYREMTVDDFIKAVDEMLTAGQVQVDVQGSVLENYKDFNDFAVKAWQQYCGTVQKLHS